MDRKTILVVDDDKLTLSTARRVLSDRFRVIPVMKGQQALTYLESESCDMILLDINMPDMDGFEVLEKIRQIEQCRTIPVVFFTADNDAVTETRCFREGALDFIAKPFVPDVMLSRIGRILEIEELRRSLADRLEQKTQEVSVIRTQSRQDALTGLWNRAHTEETVNEMIGRGEAGALMMIDMDNFKAVNDNYGHIAGDKLLKMFADTLRRFSGEGDVLCRIGGDEFVAFVKGKTSKAELSELAGNIIADLTQKIEECGFETNTSVSIGIAQTPEDGTEFTKLYNSADKALYHVKQNGKNSYHFFSDKIQAEINRGGKTVDLKYLQDMMSRADSGIGAFQLDFDSFNHIYNFICRFVGRSHRDVQILLFTVYENNHEGIDESEVENALELLEKAVYDSLRRSDVSARYSSKQLIVMLMDTSDQNSSLVAERIIEDFGKLYKGDKVRIDYGVAGLSSNQKTTERRV